jgi:hypothetical protein
MWKPQCLTTLWTFTACYTDSFTFTYVYVFLLVSFLLDFPQKSYTYACYMPWPSHTASATVPLPFKGLNRFFKQVKNIRKGLLPSLVCGSVTQRCSARMTAIACCAEAYLEPPDRHTSLVGSIYWFNWFNDSARWRSVEWLDHQWMMNCKISGRQLSWSNVEHHSSVFLKGLRKHTTSAVRVKFWILGLQNKK